MTATLDSQTFAGSPPRAAARFAHIMPLAFISYGLAFLDRVNYGQAEKPMRAALHLTPGVSSMLASLFFFGYFLFQIPGATYASKRSVKWLIFWALILWGALSGLTGIVTSVKALVAVRLSLGAIEGVVLPAMLVFLTRWFTKPERSRANALLILANPVTMIFASVICGFLIEHYDAHPFRGYVGWQMMFIMEGLPSIIWAFIWIFVARERPSDSSWLTPAEAADVQASLDAEQRDIKTVRNYWAAFIDPRVMMLAAMYFTYSNSTYGFMMWLPQTVQEGSKQGVGRAGLLQAIPYVIGMVVMMIVSRASDRSLNRKIYVAGSMLTGSAAFLLACSAHGHFWIAFIGLIIVGASLYSPCGPLWAWMGDMLPRNVVGESMALVNSCGALGGFVGTWMVGWLNGKTGSTTAAFFYESACLGIAGTLALFVGKVKVHVEPQGFPVTIRSADTMTAETQTASA